MPDSGEETNGIRFSGKVCLVTGATSGIGRATALALADAGARVHCVGRDEAKFADLLASGPSDQIVVEQVDLGEGDERSRLVERISESSGGALECVVHCAGVIEHSTFQEADPSDLERMLEVNLKAPYLLTKGLLPLLRNSKGDVVFVNSSVTRFPRAYSGQFAMTQHGLLGFAESLRAEVNPFGMRVLNVFPGKTATPRTGRLMRESGQPYRPENLLQPESVAAMILSALSLPRTAEVTEIHVRPAIKT